MKTKRSIRLVLAALIAAPLMIVLGTGCGNDNGTGSNVIPMDKITVRLTRVNVTYDCDHGVLAGKGEFYWDFSVAAQDENGDWKTVASFPEDGAKMDNDESRNITNMRVSFTLPRESGKQFRVWTQLREDDPDGNDMLYGTTTVHEYRDGQSQEWSPVGRGYSTWSASSRIGTVKNGQTLRDRETGLLGIVTEEGCSGSVTYSVEIDDVEG